MPGFFFFENYTVILFDEPIYPVNTDFQMNDIKASSILENSDSNRFQEMDDPKTNSHVVEGFESRLSQTSSEPKGAPMAEKSLGIRKSELIISQLEGRWHRGLYFFFIFIGMYITTVDNYTINIFISYATNSYKQHSLMATIGTIGAVASAASMPFFARAADVFGRLELFVVAMICKVMGIIIQSQALDIQRYAAGAVFYAFGSSGTVIVWQLCVSDASTLKWRLMALAPLCMPVIINTWSVGDITDQLLARHGWEFGIALWAFTTPLVCLPYMLTHLHLMWKASKTSTWTQIANEKRQKFLDDSPTAKRFHDNILASTTWLEKLVARLKFISIHVAKKLVVILWEMDFIGFLLLAVVLGLLLVPLTLAGGDHFKWQQASTIVPLVMGFVTIPIFVIWESKLTKKPMLPFAVMKDRGVWAALCVGVFSTLITFMPGSYAYPVLLVGMNASVKIATRTAGLNQFTEGITVPVLGLMLTKVKRAKVFIIFGNFIMFIAMGLFVHFRGSNDGIRDKYYRDGVAIAMCISGVALATFYRLTSVSIQSCTNHEYMGPVTSIFATSYTIGIAFAKSISGAIWTQEMLGEITTRMINLNVDPSLAMIAYGSPYDFIAQYQWGSPERVAVSTAYAAIQRKLSIVGLCLCVPILVFILLLRNHKLVDSQNMDDEKQKLQNTDDEKNAAERETSQIIFKDDEDPILNFLRRPLGFLK